MGKIIPWFYSDVLSRIVPGALSLALLDLWEPGVLGRLSTWIRGICGAADVLLAPLVYVGIAYVMGLLYETFLNSLGDRWLFCRAFTAALRRLPFEANVAREKPKLRSQDLAHRSVGVFHLVTTETQSSEFDHVTRFHAEAKMFFFMTLPLLFFALAILFGIVSQDCVTPQQAVLLVMAVPLCMYASFLRYRRRALQIIRFFEYCDWVPLKGGKRKLEELRTEIRRHAGELGGSQK